jgi:hypothetical protein
MSGWAEGFFSAAGEHAQQMDMMDMEREQAKRKEFGKQLLSWAQDESLHPDRRQKAMQRYQEFINTPWNKKLNYKVDDLFETQNPVEMNKNISYPGPPKEEGGPSDYANQFEARTTRSLPGENVGPWITPEEKAQQAGDAAGIKAQATFKYQEALKRAGATNKVQGGRVPMTKADLDQMGVTQPNGQPYPEGFYYGQHMADGTFMVTPAAEAVMTGPDLLGPGGEQTPSVRGRYSNDPEPINAPPGFTPSPKKIGTVVEKDENGTYYKVTYDSTTGRELSAMPFTPSAVYGSTSTNEEYIDDGVDKWRVQVRRQTSPNYQGGPTRQAPGATGGIGQPAVPGQPSPRQQPTNAGASSSTSTVALPPPPPSTRDSASNFAAQAAKAGPLGPAKVDSYTGETFSYGKDGGSVGNLYNLGASPADFRPPRDTPQHQAIREELEDKLYGSRPGVIHNRPKLPGETQLNKFAANTGVYRRTLELLEKAYDYSDVLDNPKDALKMKFLVSFSPWEEFTGRMLFKLSDRELEFAKAYYGLREHIQKMRGPLGAAGFRSVEAFESLQAQRGSILGNPQITKGVLQNSMKTFLTLWGPDEHTISIARRKANIANPIAQRLYGKAYAQETPEDVELEMLLDGWQNPPSSAPAKKAANKI